MIPLERTWTDKAKGIARRAFVVAWLAGYRPLRRRAAKALGALFMREAERAYRGRRTYRDVLLAASTGGAP